MFIKDCSSETIADVFPCWHTWILQTSFSRGLHTCWGSVDHRLMIGSNSHRSSERYLGLPTFFLFLISFLTVKQSDISLFVWGCILILILTPSIIMNFLVVLLKKKSFSDDNYTDLRQTVLIQTDQVSRRRFCFEKIFKAIHRKRKPHFIPIMEVAHQIFMLSWMLWSCSASVFE